MVRRSRWLLVAGLALGGAVLAEPNAKLQEAKKRIDALEFEAAAKLLSEAAEAPANGRVVVLEILELQGVVWGSLGRSDRARDAFRTLLLLDPAYALAGDQPPRVRTPFYAARELVGKKALTLEADVQRGPGEVIEAVGVKVKNNLATLGQVLVFRLTVGDQTRSERVKPDAAGQARVKVGAPGVQWWVELLGARDAVLVQLGSSTQPMEEAPPKRLEPPKLVEAPKPPPVPVIVTPPPPRPGWRRPTGIALLGAGAVSAGIGAVFGLQAQDARNKLQVALKDGGVITSMTQREALVLHETALGKAPVANVLFGAGAAMVAAGLVLTFTGGVSEVVVAPAPGGATVSGRF